jgi:hypothetical protein
LAGAVSLAGDVVAVVVLDPVFLAVSHLVFVVVFGLRFTTG